MGNNNSIMGNHSMIYEIYNAHRLKTVRISVFLWAQLILFPANFNA